MRCEYCEIIEDKSKSEILYQDQEIVAAVKDNVVLPGQITVFPKEHFTIMEMVPEKILKKCSVIANKIGVAVFESLGAQGTNILIQNGLGAGQKVPHFSIEIIPRNENDGLNFQWQPKQLMEDEVEGIFNILKDEAEKIDLNKKEKKEEVKESPQEKENKEENSGNDGEENYLLKSLRKIP